MNSTIQSLNLSASSAPSAVNSFAFPRTGNPPLAISDERVQNPATSLIYWRNCGGPSPVGGVMVQRPRYLSLFAGFVSATLLLSILAPAQRRSSGNDYSQIIVRVVSGPGQPMGGDIRVELLKSGVSAGTTYTNQYGEAHFDDAVPGDYAARISGLSATNSLSFRARARKPATAGDRARARNLRINRSNT